MGKIQMTIRLHRQLKYNSETKNKWKTRSYVDKTIAPYKNTIYQ